MIIDIGMILYVPEKERKWEESEEYFITTVSWVLFIIRFCDDPVMEGNLEILKGKHVLDCLSVDGKEH